ncbi:hypothetical protein BG53_10745 [Paenibacillus darwinianus]|uniref:Uncharacterized protein n=1 Tax=Paenibacillus darwinianus TaxID=1380763 RepID=A0A9W5RZA0_9BACL|nr:hypothetical protein BG53_10745 [Paenibacillus darwinianus]
MPRNRHVPVACEHNLLFHGAVLPNILFTLEQRGCLFVGERRVVSGHRAVKTASIVRIRRDEPPEIDLERHQNARAFGLNNGLSAFGRDEQRPVHALVRIAFAVGSQGDQQRGAASRRRPSGQSKAGIGYAAIRAGRVRGLLKRRRTGLQLHEHDQNRGQCQQARSRPAELKQPSASTGRLLAQLFLNAASQPFVEAAAGKRTARQITLQLFIHRVHRRHLPLSLPASSAHETVSI